MIYGATRPLKCKSAWSIIEKKSSVGSYWSGDRKEVRSVYVWFEAEASHHTALGRIHRSRDRTISARRSFE